MENTENNEIQQTNEMYIEEINKLKASTVSRDKYDQLMQENRNLLNSLVNGQPTVAAEEPTTRSKDEILKDFRKEQSNLDFCKSALELREVVLKETGEDCFVGRGHNINPTSEAYESAERVAKIMQECIDYANGDSAIFTNELQRRTQDVNIPRRR